MSKIFGYLKIAFSFWKLVKAMKRDAERYRWLARTSGIEPEAFNDAVDLEIDKEKLL